MEFYHKDNADGMVQIDLTDPEHDIGTPQMIVTPEGLFIPASIHVGISGKVDDVDQDVRVPEKVLVMMICPESPIGLYHPMSVATARSIAKAILDHADDIEKAAAQQAANRIRKQP